jgi:hypothetical protein
MRDTAGSAAAPAARSRNCRRGSFMDGPFRNAGDTPPSTGEESGRSCRIICDCACRRHQCCQLFRTRNAAHSRFMSSSWASRAPCLYAHRIALENYAPALVDGNPASNSRNWLRGFAAGAHSKYFGSREAYTLTYMSCARRAENLVTLSTSELRSDRTVQVRQAGEAREHLQSG